MYTAVLMVAMTGGAEVPDFGRRGCHGCSGCYGSCSGGCYGGCYGGCHGGRRGGLFRGRGCRGCSGVAYGCSCSGGCSGYYGPPPAGPKGENLPPPIKKTSVDMPANVLVTLPADARLTIDGQPTTSVSAVRHFSTPNLAPDRDFVYSLKAEIVRDGRRLESMRRVVVRAGQESRVVFDFNQSPVASGP
jgi:uncharacterized protein (TIGR03000 family)